MQPKQKFRIYLDPDARPPRRPESIRPDEYVFLLQGDKWDDYTYNTLFGMIVYTAEDEARIGQVRILIDIEKSTRSFLRPWAGYKVQDFLAHPSRPYVSLGADLDYYRGIRSLLNDSLLKTFLQLLRDAAYLKNEGQLSVAEEQLINSEGFAQSLQRSLSERQAYEEAAEILFRRERKRDRSFSVSYQLLTEEPRQAISINFAASDVYPSNINVLIGSNGTGKTQALKAIVGAMIESHLLPPSERSSLDSLEPRASSQSAFSQIIAISYSPFEDFPRDRNSRGATLEQYRYCGFRSAESISGGAIFRDAPIVISEIVKADEDDVVERATTRFKTFVEGLSAAITFDEVSVTSESSGSDIGTFWSASVDRPATVALPDEAVRLVLRRAGVDLILSAGQSIFVALLLSVLRYIKQDALLVIDEPELYLHPNLEVQFIQMLRMLLEAYDAFAVMATHSMIFAREVPRDRVVIFRRTNDGTIVNDRPPFETFGGDITRIANYVFDDALAEHPFLQWLTRKAGDGSFASLIRPGMTNELKILLRSLDTTT